MEYYGTAMAEKAIENEPLLGTEENENESQSHSLHEQASIHPSNRLNAEIYFPFV